jgi:uncharacterized protein YkwD
MRRAVTIACPIRVIALVAIVISAGSAFAAEPASPVDLMERRAAQEINAVRGEHMRGPLRIDPDLTRLARAYSCALLQRGSLSHTERDGKTVSDRVLAAGKKFLAIGENLASSTGPGDPLGAAIAEWMRSPAHRENILRPDFTDTGIGVCREGTTYYFTQVFLRADRAR